MKERAAIISLNKRVILKERSIRTMEAVNLRQWLLSLELFSDVHYVSSRSLSPREPTEHVDYYKEASETSLSDYQHVFLHNDTDNFMGGALGKHTVKQIKELCQFTGNVYYMYTDPNLHLVNLARVIYNRQIRETKTDFKTDLRITKTEVEQFGQLKWKVLWCGSDFKSYQNYAYSKLDSSLKCQIAEHKNVEFFKFMFANRKVDLTELPLSEREFDLVYYGNWRPKRASKIGWYLTNDLKKRVIGFDEEKARFANTQYLDYAEPRELAGLVQEAVASIVIGDPAHNNNITTARFYENILFNVCSFIDLEYDPKRKLYKDDFLKDFMYVVDRHQLSERIVRIRKDEELFKTIIQKQKHELL